VSVHAESNADATQRLIAARPTDGNSEARGCVLGPAILESSGR